MEVLRTRHEEEVKRLRSELEYVKQEATKRINEAEHVNKNLKEAFDHQNKQASRLAEENKVLKQGILSLNNKREEMLGQQHAAQQVVELQQEKIKQLEQTVFTLRMHLNQANSTHSDSGNSNHWGGGGGGGVY